MSAREQEYLEKVRSNPRDTLARYVLAKDYFDQGAHERAAEHLREIVRLKPDWMTAHILLGKSLLALGRRDEGRAALVEAERLARVQRHEGPAAEVAALLASLG